MNALHVETRHIKNDEHSPYLPASDPVESDSIVHYKRTPDHLKKVEQYETVQQHEAEHRYRNWCDEVMIDDRYE